jgi:hypothetical protein
MNLKEPKTSHLQTSCAEASTPFLAATWISAYKVSSHSFLPPCLIWKASDCKSVQDIYSKTLISDISIPLWKPHPMTNPTHKDQRNLKMLKTAIASIGLLVEILATFKNGGDLMNLEQCKL